MKKRQYCSIRCLAVDMQEYNISLDNVIVVDAKTQKLINAKNAFYVVNSKVKGTMSKVSKLAFKNKKDALEFIKKYKEKTNEIEEEFAEQGNRCVNIDPGYLVSSRFILATGKEYSHRIYIGRRIYADLTLMYSKKKGFVPLEWTYPDYASETMISFLSKVRDKYLLDLKAEKGKKND